MSHKEKYPPLTLEDQEYDRRTFNLEKEIKRIEAILPKKKRADTFAEWYFSTSKLQPPIWVTLLIILFLIMPLSFAIFPFFCL